LPPGAAAAEGARSEPLCGEADGDIDAATTSSPAHRPNTPEREIRGKEAAMFASGKVRIPLILNQCE
jgi:hypothetical protein